MNKTTKILLTIFLITLATRIFLAFAVPNFTYDSYFHLRQVEHITQHGLPLYEDSLSYGGRTLIFLPLFHYLAAFFNLFLPLEIVGKILPNLLLSLLTLIIFYIAKKISHDDTGSLFSAAIVGFLPILFNTNSFSPISLFLPLTFLTIYSFLNLEKKKALYWYIIFFLLAGFTSPAVFLLLIGFIIYILLSLIERKKLKVAEIEVILSSIFFYLWSQFLFFKDVLIQEGPGIIWQNIPSPILTDYFPTFSLTEALLFISLVPLVTGIFTIYRSLFKLKSQRSFLFISFAISTLLFASLRFIRFKLALLFVGIILAILFSVFYIDAILYWQKTRIIRLKKFFIPLIIISLLSTTVYPAITLAFNQDVPSEEDIDAFIWINEHTPKNSKILASVQEGNLLTFYSKRKNLMDDNFQLVQDIEHRYQALNSLFVTSFQTQAISLLNQYDIKYLILTPTTQKQYGIETFNYITKKCFKQVYSNKVKIYEAQCLLERK